MLFERLAVQTVVAVENAGLYRQVRYMATLEERDRLARELHDNLAQMLGYMNAKVCTAKHWLAGNQIESAFSDLLELERVTDQAYSDVREAIFSLRTIVSSGWELGPTLREYLADYNKRYGIDVQLCVEQEGLFDLTAEAQVQVLRIIQEALTNVRKHSGARGAQVRIRQAGQFTEITVEDDGTGFDAGGTSRKDARHFGLHIMRERATTVGGTLTVDSAQGHGTRVCLRVPRSDDRDSPPNPQPLPKKEGVSSSPSF
jgi:nitrate/nitrite-specific signal transduction histidine kinase